MADVDPDPRIRLLAGVPVEAAIDAAIATHVAATDPHGDRTVAATALAAHVVASDPHADRAFATTAVATHAAATDPHADRAFATTSIATHAAASDPHGDRAYAVAQDTIVLTTAEAYTDTVAATKVPTSRQVLAGTGLTGGGTLAADRTLTVSYGTASGTSCQGNDSRLSDSRTPTTHASSHASAGSDPITISTSQITGLATVATSGSAADLGSGTLPAGRMPAHTGDVTTVAGAVATTIAAGAVTLAKQANLAANSIQGNNTGSPATPIALTVAQTKTLLAIANTDVSGLGTMSTQAASSVAITGGAIDGTPVGATTKSTGYFTVTYVKQSADSNASGVKIERSGTSDYQVMFMAGSLGSLQDVLIHYSNFGGNVHAFDRSGIGYHATKLLIGSTTDDTVNALQVTGRGKVTSTMQVGVTTVAALPTGSAGQTAFASNGRKNGEGAGSGTGVLVFHDGTAWRACDTGATVAA